jgi:rod shape-determining protein MreC
MLKFFFKNLSRFFLLVVFMACVWLLVHRNSYPSGRTSSLKNVSMSLWLPLQRSVNWLITLPENAFNAIRELRNLRKEVERLQVENQSLHMELSNHKSLESELTRLKEVLKIKSRMSHKAQIARIIAHDPSTWTKSFVIDLGSDDGVLPDSPVISEQGIVGRVLETMPKNSRVLLLTDTDSSVSGIDQRSQVTGVVLGTGRGEFKYGYVNAGEDVQKDDVIVSSGLGGIFPKGYVIGSVVRKVQSDNGLNTEILVAPAVDFAALDYVFVLPPINVYE